MPLNHHREGSGEPLVLIHGTGSQWQVWQPLIDRLRSDRDVIALDLPGFGGSPPLRDDGVVTAHELTDVVASFLDELGLDRPTVGGNSLGGGIALELARRGRARAAVPLAPIGFWTPREQRWCVRKLRLEQRNAQAVAALRPQVVRNPVARTILLGSEVGRPWRVPSAAAEEMFVNFARAPGFDPTNDGLLHYTFAAGEEIRVPVTVMWGTRDTLLLPRQAERARRVIPGAELVWLRGAAHVPTWDAPDEIADVLRGA